VADPGLHNPGLTVHKALLLSIFLPGRGRTQSYRYGPLSAGRSEEGKNRMSRTRDKLKQVLGAALILVTLALILVYFSGIL